MNQKTKTILLNLFPLLILGLLAFQTAKNSTNSQILAYIVDPKTQNLQFFWKNDKGEILKSIQNLKDYVEHKNSTLIFATNGGMYMQNNVPLGLFIEQGKIQKRLNTSSGKGNFYLKPNGVFYITTDNIPFVCKTADFKNDEKIKYATQSGPMLVVDGQINAAFKANSQNLNIRNGVGILPNNKVVFAMSKKEINFYDFAKYFQNLGCKSALYLDGFVSRTYLPKENWKQTDGNFGVIIGVTNRNE